MPNTTKRKRGRPKKYHSEEERRKAKRASDLKYKRKNLEKIRKKNAELQRKKRKAKKSKK